MGESLKKSSELNSSGKDGTFRSNWIFAKNYNTYLFFYKKKKKVNIDVNIAHNMVLYIN